MAKTFTAGDKVFAKVRGYPAWPARVDRVSSTTPSKAKYQVFFYGTSQTAMCKAEDLYHYAENKEKFRRPLKRKAFNEALAQIEGLFPVPQSMPSAEPQHEAEDSDGEGNLVIDESPALAGGTGRSEEGKKKAVKPKWDSDGGVEDGRNSMPVTGSAVSAFCKCAYYLPPSKRSKHDGLAAAGGGPTGSACVTNTAAPASPPKPEIVSRLGHKIKPEKFADEPLDSEPKWLVMAEDPGLDPLAPPVQPEPGAPAVKTEVLDPLAPPFQPEPGAPVIKTEVLDPLAPPVQPEPGAPVVKTQVLDPLAPPVQPEPGAPVVKTEVLDPLTPLVKQEPEATIKTEAGWPGCLEQAARAGVGPDRWLAAVRISGADRAAAEAQLSRQQLPALANIKKEEAYMDPELEFADLSDSSGDSDAEPQSSEEWEPPEPRRWTRGLDGPGVQHATAQQPCYTAGSCSDRGQTLGQSGTQQPKDNLLQCQQCGKVFPRLSHLQRHERVHSGMRPFVCPHCGAGFKHKHDLQRHSLIHTGEKSHSCAECGHRFALLSQLRRHELFHTGARPHPCPDCSRRFREVSQRRTHQRAVHLKQRPHTCPDCGQRFSQAWHLLTHQRAVHLKQRPHACPDCDQRFSRAGSLRTHQQAVHLNKRPHACPDCDQRFTRAAHLRVHQEAVHLMQRPHACPDCGRRFSTKRSLGNHVLTHSGAKPHACEVCGRHFREIGGLRKHSLIHSGQKPFSCDSCGHCFRLKANLKRHVQIHLAQGRN